MTNQRKLYRNVEEGKIFGVCSGLSDYLDIDVTVIRVIWLILLFCAGSGLLAYLIMALVISPKPKGRPAEPEIINDNDDPFAKYD